MQVLHAYFSRMLHVCDAYSSRILRILSVAYVCVFFAYVVRILRACSSHACVTHYLCVIRIAYSSHTLRIILVYDMRVLRVSFAYATHHPCVWYAYSLQMLHIHASSLRMICVFFAYVTNPCIILIPWIWYAYSSHMLHIHTSSLSIICVFFAYVTHPCIILAYDMRILRVCYAYPRVCYACSLRMLRLSYVNDTDGGGGWGCSQIPSNFLTKYFYDALLKC